MEGHSARFKGIEVKALSFNDLSLQLSATEETVSITFKGEIFKTCSVQILSVLFFLLTWRKSVRPISQEVHHYFLLIYLYSGELTSSFIAPSRRKKKQQVALFV